MKLKGIRSGKDRAKLSLLTDDMTVFEENLLKIYRLITENNQHHGWLQNQYTKPNAFL